MELCELRRSHINIISNAVVVALDIVFTSHDCITENIKQIKASPKKYTNKKRKIKMRCIGIACQKYHKEGRIYQ